METRQLARTREAETIESVRFYEARASGLDGCFSAAVRRKEPAWKRGTISCVLMLSFGFIIYGTTTRLPEFVR
jgi:hypothetical protein